MSNPTLTTDYDVEWSPVAEGFLQEGEDLARGVVTLPNGYSVSFIRTNIERDGIVKSVGYDDGGWETVIVRPATSAMAKMVGWEYEPAEGFDHLYNDELEGFPVGNFDNEGLNNLFAQVASADEWVAPDAEDDILSMLTTIFGGPAEDEEESA